MIEPGHENHVLILGGGRQLVSMISALTDDRSVWKDSEIVVLTTQWDNENDLRNKELAQKAQVIYIIGEDQEPNHDSVSIRCCQKLQKICRGTGRTIPCYLVFQNPSSFDVYNKDVETLDGTDLRVDVVNAKEHLAEQVLVADHNGIDEVDYPKIDYRRIPLESSGFRKEEGIREEDGSFVHFAIAGMTDIARAMALTAAHNCHFPNFKEGKNRTVISFIDTGMVEKMDRFIDSLTHLFKLSHYRYISFDEKGQPHVIHHVPDVAYGDFLDIEWEFIDGNIRAPGVRTLLEKWAVEPERSLSFAICYERQEDNTTATLHLPSSIYASGCPVFTHLEDDGNVLYQDDPLFLARTKKGQRVNFIYNQNYDAIKYPDPVSAWYAISEVRKLSSIYCANALNVRKRSFDLGNGHGLSSLTEAQRHSLFDTEHRRWMMSALLLGYAPVEQAVRDAWKARRLSTDSDTANAAKEEYQALKSNHFIHLDITPYDDLIPEEQEKDEIILNRINEILR